MPSEILAKRYIYIFPTVKISLAFLSYILSPTGPYGARERDGQEREPGNEVVLAREAHFIHKGNTLSPLGINRRDEAH